MHNKLSCLFAIIIALASVTVSQAQQRTTPTEVTNTPSVSVTNTPDVNVTNSPTVKIDAVTNTVKATQSGPWTVGVTGTPGVTIANTPSVKIDPTGSNVINQAKSQRVMLLTADYTIPANGNRSFSVTCTGYKEARLFLWSLSSFETLKKAMITFYWHGKGYGSAFWAKDGGYGSGYVDHPGFTVSSWCFSIILPVLGDSLSFSINNYDSSGDILLGAANCWVYLTN